MEIEEIRFYVETLQEIAEDCQLEHGVNSPGQLKQFLGSYTHYKDCINSLSEDVANSCIQRGFLKAEWKHPSKFKALSGF